MKMKKRQVMRLLRDKTLYRKIKDNAFKMINKKYTWDRHMKKLESILTKLVKGESGSKDYKVT